MSTQSIQYINQMLPAMEALAKALGIDMSGLTELEVCFRVGGTTSVRVERIVLNHEMDLSPLPRSGRVQGHTPWAVETMETKLEEFYSIDGQVKHVGGRIPPGQAYIV